MKQRVVHPQSFGTTSSSTESRAAAEQSAAQSVEAALSLDGKARTAVLVVHGMGQQQPFQTLDAVVDGLGSRNLGSRVRLVRVGDTELPQAEVELASDGDDDPCQVHFYEGYWAPLTEGKVNLRDVMSFLLAAGWNGMRSATRPFSRYMFGREVVFGRSWKTTFYLAMALAVLFALVVVNLVAGGVTSAIVLANGSDWIDKAFLSDVSSVLGVLILFVGVCGAGIYLARSRLAMFALFSGIVLSGVAMALLVVWHKWHDDAVLGLTREPWGFVLMWFAVLGFSLLVRKLMVQYVGDVAAYVTPHRLDRFAELRSNIKRVVRRTARAVYEARDEQDNLLYDRVVIVAHSLGSVIAYDTLNGLLNEDMMNGGALRVQERTKTLITFGSPLDKIAFLFKTQSLETGCTRENLAAAKQPLIQDYKFRQDLEWINVYSPADIISGSLDFFDDTGDEGNAACRVRNVVDPASNRPLAAHVEYWKNETVFDALRAAVVK